MLTHFTEQEICYTGGQLSSHWANRTFGLEGDCVVAFVGPCEVKGEALVDLEDARAGEMIIARRMLHFIIEHFDPDLEKAILRQRLLVAIGEETLKDRGVRGLVRRGDDLYIQGRKLTVSIATVSLVSTLIHLGINVDPEGATVAAIGLDELRVSVKPLAEEIMQAFVKEMESIRKARMKVKGVL